MTDYTELELDWAKLLFKSQIDDIRFAKEMQLKITYYTILIYGGIFYLIKEKLMTMPCTKIISFIIYFVIAYISHLFVWNIQNDIVKYRGYIKEIKNKFPVIPQLIKELKNDVEEYTFLCYKIQYLILYTSLIYAGAIFFYIQILLS